MGKKFIIGVLIFFAVLIAAFTFAFYFLYRRIPVSQEKPKMTDLVRFTLNPGELFFRNKDYALILVMGLDYDWTPDNMPSSKKGRTDTIFVLRVEKNGEKINLLSIPRDLRVLISEEYGFDRINAAFSLGQDQEEPDPQNPWQKGVEKAREVIRNYLGISIDHYALLKVMEVKKLIDALGGVPVNVEKDMDYDDSWGHLHVHLKQGMQRLNGDQAIGYCRFRYDPEGDRGRIRRQQQFMLALIKELKKPTNLTRLDKIVRAAKECIDTDISDLSLLDLARVYRKFSLQNLKTGMVDGEDQNIGGASYIIGDEKKKSQLVRELLLGLEKVTPQDINILILNGCGIPGAAAKLADLLAEYQYNVAKVDNALNQDYQLSEIIDHYNNAAISEQLKALIPEAGLTLDPEEGKNSEYDFTIIIGKDLAERLQVPDF